MKKHRWFAVISAMVMALAAFGCKTDTETKIEYVDKKADETAPASVQNLPLHQKTAVYFLHGKMLLTATFTATK